MNPPLNPYVFPALMVADVAALLAVFIWRRRSAPGAKSSALLMAAIAEWALAYTFELAATDVTDKLIWAKVEYIGIVLIPLAWLAFALAYTGRGRILSRRNLALLAIHPVVTLALVWTNEWHGLIWSQVDLYQLAAGTMLDPTHGPAFWLHATYSYALMAICTVLLVQAFVRSDSIYRRQAAALVISTLAPWVGNALYLFDWNPFPYLDLTPLFFALSGAVMAWGLYRYRLMDIVPVARHVVLENLRDGVLVLDAQSRIVDANPTAQALVGCGASCIGKPADIVLSAHTDLVERFRDVQEAHVEFSRGEGDAQRHFDLTISPLDAGPGRRPGGRLLVIRDITAHKQAEKETAQLYTNLQTQLEERRRAEEALIDLNDQLERRVVERTAALDLELIERKRMEAENRRRADQLETLRQIGLEISSNLDLQSVLLSIGRRAIDLMGVVTCSFYLYRRDLDVIERVAFSGPRLVDSAETRQRGQGLIGKVWESGQPIWVNDYGHWSERNPAYDASPSRNVMGMPLVWGDQFLGVANIVSEGERRFGEPDVELMRLFATQAATAIRNAQLYQAAQQEIAERKRAEQALVQSNKELEMRVQERTAGLESTNLALQKEIAERTRVEQELQVQRDFAMQVMTTMGQGLTVTGPDSRFEFVNPAYATMIGRSAQELIGQRPKDLTVTDDHATLARARAQRQQGETTSYETRFQHTDGHIVHALVTGVPRYQDGHVVGTIAVITDLSERLRAEEQIKQLNHDLELRVAERTRQLADKVQELREQVAERERIELAERDQRQLAEALRDAAASLNNTLDSSVVLEQMLESVKRVVPYDAATIMLIHQDTAQVVRCRGYAERGEDAAAHAWKAVIARTPGLREMNATGAPHIVADIGACPGWDDSWHTRWEQSFLGVPINTQGKVIGFLNLYAAQVNFYTPDHAHRLQALADQVSIALANARLFDDVQRHLERVEALHTIDRAISSSFDIRVTLNVVLEQVATQLGVDGAAVLLLNPHSQTLRYAATRGVRIGVLQRTQWHLGEGNAGRAALERRTVTASDGDTEDRALSPALKGDKFVAYMATPLIAKGQVKGVLEVFHRAALDPDAGWIDYLETLAGQAAIAVDNADLFSDLQSSHSELILAYDATLAGWSHALELRDRETDGHSQRVTEMTERLVRAMGMPEDEVVHARRGALLHDIGKMGVPDAILLKPGPLTDDERAIMQMHTVYAYQLLLPIAYLRPAVDIPYCHHEKWDGTGYPRHLKGQEIPLAARVFAVADVWDALSSDRPYRQAWTTDRVREYIRSNSGTHFDPLAVQAFLDLY